MVSHSRDWSIVPFSETTNCASSGPGSGFTKKSGQDLRRSRVSKDTRSSPLLLFPPLDQLLEFFSPIMSWKQLRSNVLQSSEIPVFCSAASCSSMKHFSAARSSELKGQSITTIASVIDVVWCMLISILWASLRDSTLLLLVSVPKTRKSRKP